MRWGQFMVGRRLKLWVCWMMFVDVWRLAWFWHRGAALSDNSRAALHCAGIPGTQSCNYSIPQGIRFRLMNNYTQTTCTSSSVFAHTAENLPAILCRTHCTKIRKSYLNHTMPVLSQDNKKKVHQSSQKKSHTVMRLGQAEKQKHIR